MAADVNLGLRQALADLKGGDTSGWAYFDDGRRMLRSGRALLKLTDGREVTPAELRVGDEMRSSDGQRVWTHRVVRVETVTRVLDTVKHWTRHEHEVEVEVPGPSRYERLMTDD